MEPRKKQLFNNHKLFSYLVDIALLALAFQFEATVQGNEIDALNFQCVPCMMFGGYYCYDDPWSVNYNGDRCYEYAVDRL